MRRLALLLLLTALAACDDDDDAGAGQTTRDRGPAADAAPQDGGARLDQGVTPIEDTGPGGDAEPPGDARVGTDAGPAADAGGDAAADGMIDVDRGPGEDAAPVDDAAAMDDAAPDATADAAPRVDAAPPGEGCAAYAGLEGDALRDRLHRAVQQSYAPIDAQLDQGGNPNRYTTARRFMFTQVERRPGPGGQAGVECVYTGRFVAIGPDEEPNHNDFNAEHVWPRSRMDGDRESVLFSHHESDVHNLWPSDAAANSARGSFRFGAPVRDRVLDHSPSVLGTDASGDTVFEVRAARRGDVARTVLYFSVRWGLDLPVTEEATVRGWHAEDPPDDLERARNDAVEDIQGNRNPFIDCPELVERVDDFEAFPPLDGALPAP